jgi:hypothetical protein
MAVKNIKLIKVTSRVDLIAKFLKKALSLQLISLPVQLL